MTIKIILFAVFTLSLTGCRGALPCPDCDPDDDDDPMAEGAVPDLPCDGADLQNDALNCGSCGFECTIMHADTEYAVGQCNDGVCGGPFWYEQVYPDIPSFPSSISCAEVCANNSRSCVARGCSGKTGYLCSYFWGEGCLHTYSAIDDWTGECNEDVPPFVFDDSVEPAIGCCCDD